MVILKPFKFSVDNRNWPIMKRQFRKKLKTLYLNKLSKIIFILRRI